MTGGEAADAPGCEPNQLAIGLPLTYIKVITGSFR
jgi:hypothetical protein